MVPGRCPLVPGGCLCVELIRRRGWPSGHRRWAWLGPPAVGPSPPSPGAPMRPDPPFSPFRSGGDSGLRPSPCGRPSALRIPSYPPFTPFRSGGDSGLWPSPFTRPLVGRALRASLAANWPSAPATGSGGNPLRGFRPILPSLCFGRMVTRASGPRGCAPAIGFADAVLSSIRCASVGWSWPEGHSASAYRPRAPTGARFIRSLSAYLAAT